MRTAVAALWVLLASGPPAFALPDLVPGIDAISIASNQTVSSGDVAEGCAATQTGRTLVRFGVRFYNIGADPLVIGDPMCPDCSQNPGVVCGDPRFICSPADGHDHPHYIDFARYELVDADGRLLALGAKRSFCIRESWCPPGTPVTFTCDDMGVQSGCYDYYAPSLGCQYIDATDVPDVQRRALRIRVTLDPDRTLPDANRSNNHTVAAIPGCGDGLLQPGEACDPGPAATQPCCDPGCCGGCR
jgi:hypothetical protein